MSKAPSVDTKKMKKLLAARREELLTLIDVGEETRTDTELDQQRIGRLSRMDAMRQQAMEDETGRRRDKELHRIASALDRLESEDFGYCTACDLKFSHSLLFKSNNPMNLHALLNIFLAFISPFFATE